MIVELKETSTVEVSKKLLRLRNEVGAMAMGRVLTLVIETDAEGMEDALAAATQATRLHPSRVIALSIGDGRGKGRLDAQIRVGGDAGASEVVVLEVAGELTKHTDALVTPLLLPDSPLVVWWPGDAPAGIAQSPLGKIAHRRITDAAASPVTPRTILKRRADNYCEGNTDLAWTRLTRWRGLLAASLDMPPFEPVTGAVVVGAVDSPSADLLAGWLAVALRCPVTLARSEGGSGIISVRLERESGPIDLVRPEGEIGTLTQPGQPDRRISLAHRELAECLADELHRLDTDEIYEKSLIEGLAMLTRKETTAEEAVADGVAPDPEHAKKVAAAALKRTQELSAAALEAKETPK